MGLFDSLKKDKKRNKETVKEEMPAEQTTVSEEQQEDQDQVLPIEPEEEALSMAEKYLELDDDEQLEVFVRDIEPDRSESASFRKIKPYSEKSPVTHVVGQTKIIAIINQKGGVGKSTTAINLSAALGEYNKAVLLVDLDPQGNTSSGLGIEKSQVNNCVYDVLLNDMPIQKVIVPDVCKGVDVVPSTINLAGAEVELVSEMARENRLKDALGCMRGRYDYIFIDCPPSLGLLTLNALVAADKLFIPIQCEFYALEGVTKLLDSMKRVQTRLNPTLDIFGVLLTMFDGRTNICRQVAEEVRSFFGKAVFETTIPRAVRIAEAPSFGQAITEYEPNCKGAQAYYALAKEVINRG